MGLVLRDGVSFCETSGRLLFLDVRRDRYFCLAPPTEAAFQRLVRRDQNAGDTQVEKRLLADGLLRAVPGDAVPTACALPMPIASALDDAETKRSTGQTGALLRLARSELSLRFLGLRRALRGVARHKARARATIGLSDAAIAAPGLGFHAAALLASPLDRCLPRSIATAHRYFSLGIRVDLVIGVKLQPFAAHCWVQRGELLLNDRLDTVRNFTPILAI